MFPTYQAGEGSAAFLARWSASEDVLEYFATTGQALRAGYAALERHVPEMFAAGDPLPMRVVERREDGSGVVEIPIAVEVEEIDLGKTQSQARGKSQRTRDDLDSMVQNFDQWPGPIPVGFGDHVGLSGSAGFSSAFFRSVERRGSVLWAQVDLNASAFFEVVELRGWRGFSHEALIDPDLPDRKLDGMVLVGGVFTNRPALDVHFDLAEAAAVAVGFDPEALAPYKAGIMACSLDPVAQAAATDTEGDMTLKEAQEKLKKAEKDLEALSGTAEELETTKAALADAEKKSAGLEERLAALEKAGGDGDDAAALRGLIVKLGGQVESLQGKLGELAGEIASSKAESLSARVLAIAEGAIDRGLPPVLFEGVKDDPKAWFESMGFTDVAALEKFVGRIPTGKAGGTASGAGGSDEHEPGAGKVLPLSPKARRELEAAGLDPDAIEQDKEQPAPKKDAAAA